MARKGTNTDDRNVMNGLWFLYALEACSILRLCRPVELMNITSSTYRTCFTLFMVSLVAQLLSLI
jgi:hypothetical protein